MTERRARGTSPSGRGDRRTSRAASSRPKAAADADSAAARRAARRRPEAERRTLDRKAQPRRIPARENVASAQRAAEDRHERTFFGLSTGKAVILAAVVCALALTLAVPMRTYFSQRAEAAQLGQERQELESDLAALRDRRAQQQDPAYIRSEARDRLRLVQPGETPYIVQVPGIEAPAPPAAPTKSKQPDPWYTDLWQSVAQPQPSSAPQDPNAPHDQEGPR
ncbi:FtsB family cell division protein [Nocardia callitridis]|uniref:Septum formation initiator family protein n=1 Tax=Nocardia callitridis TaxID=648753 RepID=A0ABP9JUX3_9NOCA